MGWEEEKGNRYKLSRERGAIFKDWGGKISIALIYPDRYYAGMSSLGFQTIYGLLNKFPGIVCERVFYPESSSPKILSLESSRPLSDFTVLAFSLSYELDYFYALQILRRSGIPLLSEERDETYPLIIAGGPCVISNSEPISPFFDAFALGEGEVLLPPFISCFSEYINASRKELLSALSNLPGYYIPQIKKERVMRQWARDLNAFDTTSVVLTPDTELANMYLIEVERGCERSCRFCLAGFAFRPTRYRSIERIVNSSRKGLVQTKRIGLIGAAILDHPDIENIVLQIRNMDATVSCSSLRGDALTENLVRALAEGGNKTLTLAPETGSNRLRRFIGKELSNEDLYKAAELAIKNGIEQLKLYFMIGLPGEREEDTEETISLVLKLQESIKRKSSECRLVVNVSPFNPKKGTPFFRYPMQKKEILNSRLKRIHLALRPKGVKVKSESIAWCQVQTVLSRGDASISRAISEVKSHTLEDWQRAFEETGVDVDYWAHQDIY